MSIAPDGGRRPRGIGWAAPATSEPSRPQDAGHGQDGGWVQTRAAQDRRRLAHQQILARRAEAARLDGAAGNGEDPAAGYVAVRIQWAVITRYETDFYVSPYATEAELWQEIGMVEEWQRSSLDVVDGDNQIISIVDLDGDRRASVLERAISVTARRDWGDLADSIDERLAASWEWPALSAALDRAAAAGYDVDANLPLLAAEPPLPGKQPAAELRTRLMRDCDAALPVAAEGGAASSEGDTSASRRRPEIDGPTPTTPERGGPSR